MKKLQTVIIVFLSLIILCGIAILFVHARVKNSADTAADPALLSEEFSTPSPTPTAEPTPTPVPTPSPTPYISPIDFAYWTGINDDIYAWIHIDDTNIDYPVLQDDEDDTFYLTHDEYRNSSVNGTVFSERIHNARDFHTDPVVLLYGHHMRSGAIFGYLQSYYQDDEFFEKDNPILIYTPEEMLVYRVFAAVPYSDDHLLYWHDFSDSEEFIEFFQEIRAIDSDIANFNDAYYPEPGDHVLVLSTCMSDNNYRYLIMATQQNGDDSVTEPADGTVEAVFYTTDF